MKLRLSLALAVLLLVGIVPARAVSATSCAPPRCVEVEVPVPQGLKVPDRHVRVLLPQAYSEPGTRFPVLYLLHGVGDDYRSWSDNVPDLAALADQFGLIVVTPDGGRGSEAGWYSDWQDGSRQWETFHTDVLISYIDDNYRTFGAGHRAVAGNSMGGLGAMYYSWKHPGLFDAAATISGFVDTSMFAPVSGRVYDFAGAGCCGGQSLGTPRSGVWGEQGSEAWNAHDPTLHAADLRDAGVWLSVASGNGEPRGAAGDDPSKPHAYPTERYISMQNDNFTAALTEAGVAYRSDSYAGYHDWPYFANKLADVLPGLAEQIAAPRTGSIIGSVTKNTLFGKPIRAATVDCRDGGSASTTVSGEYAIAHAPLGRHVCTASAAGYKPVTKEVGVIADAQTVANFALRKR